MIWRSQTASFLFFTLVSLKTGISGCGSPFLIFLYRRSCVDTSASVKSFTLRIHLTIEITRILRQRLKSRLLRDEEKNRCLTLRIISAKAPEFFIWRSLSSYSDNLTLISQIPVRQIHIFKIHLLRTQLSRTHLFQNQLLHIHQSQSRQTHSPH